MMGIDYDGETVSIEDFEKFATSKGFPKPVEIPQLIVEGERLRRSERGARIEMDYFEQYVSDTLIKFSRGYAHTFKKFYTASGRNPRPSGVSIEEFYKLAHEYGYKITDYKPSSSDGRAVNEF
jgi:hypothetical protein